MVVIFGGGSIECLGAEMVARKFVPGLPQHIPGVGDCFVYKCERNSEATITKEVLDKADRAARYDGNALLDLGDKLEGEDVFIIVQKRLKIELVNHSGRHKAQAAVSNCFTYAKIEVPFPNIPVLKDPKQIELRNKVTSSNLDQSA